MRTKIWTYFSFFIFLFLFSIQSISADTLPLPFRVIPSPTRVELQPGSGLNFGSLKAVLLKNSIKRPVMPPLLTFLPETDAAKEGVLSLEIVKTKEVPESQQGYVLEIGGNKVRIMSHGAAGIFYGCQTLQQLLEDSRDTGTPVPACKITDYPALSYRAVHWDVKHHLDQMHYYYESINRLARYKINGIIFELEDKLRYRRRPEIGAPQAISIEEMAALTEYARDRHIEISPLIQGLGHATFILKHEKYKHLRELENNRWAFCPMDEGTYQVLFDLYLDAIEATPGSRYLHIGGDEVGNIGLCYRCKDFAEKNGVLALNLYWLNRVCEFAEQHGRIPIFWDDMPFKYANLWKVVESGQNINEIETEILWKKNEPILNKMLDKFPKNAVYMRWIYGKTNFPGNVHALKWYRDSGLKTMIATAAQTSTELMPGYDRVGYIKEFIDLAAKYRIGGMLCTAWDDSSPLMEMYWRGFIASAEYAWTPNKRDLEAYRKALYQREYGPETVPFWDLYQDLYQQVQFWKKAPFVRGTRRSRQNFLQDFSGLEHWIRPQEQKKKEVVDYEKKLIGVPDLNNPGSWSEKFSEHIREAEQAVQEYQKTSQQIGKLIRISRRNRYYWEAMQATNDFQVTTAKLILALQKCDTGNRVQLKKGIQTVQSVEAAFKKSWDNLQNVYSKIRFIKYPPNYQKDRYFHFASQREGLSFLIQAEELYYQMIGRWLKEADK